MRDMGGQRPRWSPPYGHTQDTTEAFSAGLPFPVYCGWGGMVRVAAQPLADGLRFRKHLDGECQASECRCGGAGGGRAGRGNTFYWRV
jgi:hypothetical protein